MFQAMGSKKVSAPKKQRHQPVHQGHNHHIGPLINPYSKGKTFEKCSSSIKKTFPPN